MANKEDLYPLQNKVHLFERVILFWPKLFEREEYKQEAKKYSVRIMVEKHDPVAMAMWNELIQTASQLMWMGSDGTVQFDPNNDNHSSIVDGDMTEDANKAGTFSLKASCNEFPDLYSAGGGAKIDITQRDYHPYFSGPGGALCRAVITMWYEKNNKRIVFDLGMLQYTGAMGREITSTGGRPDYSAHVASGPAPGGAPPPQPGYAPPPQQAPGQHPYAPPPQQHAPQQGYAPPPQQQPPQQGYAPPPQQQPPQQGYAPPPQQQAPPPQQPPGVQQQPGQYPAAPADHMAAPPTQTGPAYQHPPAQQQAPAPQQHPPQQGGVPGNDIPF